MWEITTISSLIQFRIAAICMLSSLISSHTYSMRNSPLTCTQNSPEFQISNDNSPYPLTFLLFSSWSLFDPQNTDICYPFLSPHAIMISWHTVQHNQRVASSEHQANSAPAQIPISYLLSLTGPWSHLLSTFVYLPVNTSIEPQPPSYLTSSVAHCDQQPLVNHQISHNCCSVTHYRIITILASNVLFKCTLLRPASLQDCGLQVHSWSNSIAHFKFTSWMFSGASPSLLHYGFMYVLKFTQSCSLRTINSSFPVYLWIRWIAACIFIQLCPPCAVQTAAIRGCMLPQWWTWSVSWNLLDRGLPVHVQSHMIVAYTVHLQTCLNNDCKCIPEFT